MSKFVVDEEETKSLQTKTVRFYCTIDALVPGQINCKTASGARKYFMSEVNQIKHYKVWHKIAVKVAEELSSSEDEVLPPVKEKKVSKRSKPMKDVPVEMDVSSSEDDVPPKGKKASKGSKARKLDVIHEEAGTKSVGKVAAKVAAKADAKAKVKAEAKVAAKAAFVKAAKKNGQTAFAEASKKIATKVLSERSTRSTADNTTATKKPTKNEITKSIFTPSVDDLCDDMEQLNTDSDESESDDEESD